MDRVQKAEVVEEIAGLMKDSNAVYFIDYSGVNVEDISNIRSEFRKEGIKYKVFKNTLLVRAMRDLGWENAEEVKGLIAGMTGVAFVGENIASAAKIVKTYFDKNQKFALKCCVLENTIYGPTQLDVLASIPGRKELMASVVGSINAPASGIVGAINAVMRDLALVISEIEKKKAA